MKSLDDLCTIRIYDLTLIPRYLLEQVKSMDWDIDQIYKMSKQLCSDPQTILCAIIDKQKKIKGVIWLRLDLISKILFINLLSIDKEYQFEFSKMRKLMKEYMEKFRLAGVKKVMWSTTRPRAYERMGFKRSKRVLMEVPLWEMIPKELLLDEPGNTEIKWN